MAIIIKNGIPHRQIKLRDSSIEATAIELQKTTKIIAAYNPPANKIKTQDLDALMNIENKVALIRDFNA